ncbi:DUF6531 domain-containing protein [Parahaliea maris]|nr:DUF6531 domain-containing protein [Parahaliea maris]
MFKQLITLVVTLVPACSQAGNSGTSETPAGATITPGQQFAAPITMSDPPDNPAQPARGLAALSAVTLPPSISGPDGYSDPITFSEFPEGTDVTTSYEPRGIHFGGTGPTIVTDTASLGEQVLSGGDNLMGEIFGRFVLPGTNIPAPVAHMGFDIGSIEASNSVKLEFYGDTGQIIYETYAPSPGFFRLNHVGGSVGIYSWRAFIVGTEPAGFGIDNIYFSEPGVRDDLDREQGEGCPSAGNPVTPSVGNKFQEEIDYQGSKPFPLLVRRAYNSLGGKWQLFPEVVHDGSSVAVEVVRDDGKGFTFLGWGLVGGSYMRSAAPNMTGQLFAEPGGWRYETLDDLVEQYDAAGRILSRTNRAGISHTYTYSSDSVTVSHSLGGALTYHLDDTGRVTGFTDPGGNHYAYSYDTNGMHTSVSYPDELGSRIYHYENSSYPELLTGITDANGDRFASWTYDSDRRATSSAHNAGADLTTFDYTLAEDIYPRVTVTNPLGKQTTYLYVVANGQRLVWDVDGHASANCVAASKSYRYDSRAFINSRRDWEDNLTVYTRDYLGRELTRTEALGSAVERSYQTTWHPAFNLPSQRIEPGVTTDYQYDTNGNLISTQATLTPLN